MEALNFGTLAETSISTTSYLKAWNIYENVKLESIEGPTTGTSAQGNEWSKYDFTFSCPEGIYKHSLFEPKSAQRPTYKNPDGTERKAPSQLEQTMDFLTLVGMTFNPEGFKKVQAAASKVSSFDQLIAVFKKFVGTPETTTCMKLVGRNNNGAVYATFPNYCVISSKDNKTFIPKDCVFGDALAFTPYEAGKKKEFETSKPTPVKKETNDLSVDTTTEEDDLGDLLNDL